MEVIKKHQCLACKFIFHNKTLGDINWHRKEKHGLSPIEASLACYRDQKPDTKKKKGSIKQRLWDSKQKVIALKRELAKKKWDQKKERTPSFYKSWGWRVVRLDALAKCGRKCLVCGANWQQKQLHVDHIKPRSHYPELELDVNNLQVLCIDCNLGKGNRDETDWRKI